MTSTTGHRAREGGTAPKDVQKRRLEEAQNTEIRPGILRELRTGAGLTQQEVADACGWSHADHVRRYERTNAQAELTESIKAMRLLPRLMIAAGVYDIREVITQFGGTEEPE